MNLLHLAGWRYLARHPWQLLLAILGVGLGVSVVVAVDLANESAGRAFTLSMDALSGQATHRIVAGPGGIDERLFVRLRLVAADLPAAPVVEAFGTVAGETLHVLGVDPLSEAGFREHLGTVGEGAAGLLMGAPDAVLMAKATAGRLGLQVDEPFTLAIAGREHRLRLAGLIRPGAQAAALEGLLLTDIAIAQELAGRLGRLSWIDLRLPERAAAVERLSALLPPAAELEPVGKRTRAARQMTRAFRTNLQAMGLLALVIGMFLIYNTMTFVVLQRRRLLGTLRILGVTRGEVFRVVLGEAVVIGLIGTMLGLVAGIGIGQGLVRLVTRTINDHYFVLTVSSFLVTAAPLLKGAALGLGATLVATLVPAFEAAYTPPLAALQRSQLEQKAHRLAPRLAVGGLGMVATALLTLVLSGRAIGSGFVALFLLIIGLALVSPWLVFRFSRLAAPPLGRWFGLQVRLAIGGVADSLSRTGIAIAALMLAVATLVGVGVMIASFRASVDVWLQSTLRADIYVGLPSIRSSTTRGSLDPVLIEHLRELPGIAGLSTGRGTRVAGEHGHTEVFALGLSPGLKPYYPLQAGDPDEVWDRFGAGEAVLVSEPLAWHRGLAVGDQVSLRTDDGPQHFAVAGIYHDYGTGEGEVLMPRVLYDRHFADRGVSALGIYIQPAADPDAVLAAVRAQVAATATDQQVLVRPGGEIRAQSLEIFDRTFTITRVLRLLAVLVAFIGILSAFMALQLERARELAILRATGMTPGQVGGLVTLQTLFMGLVAGLLALPTGLVLAQVLIQVINRRSFGWSMQTLVEPGILIQAVLLSVAAALLAAVYPGWRMAHTSPAAALREE